MAEERTPNKVCYTVEQATDEIGIGRTLLYREIKLGRIEVVKAGKRTLIPGEALKEWLNTLRRERDARLKKAL